jgi:hypothetical protein
VAYHHQHYHHWLPYTQVFRNTGRFIMFSVITHISNKKTKGPTLMELFKATGKLKKVFFLTTRDVRCVHHEWHGTHRYDIQVLATYASTWVNRYSSLLQWSVPLGQRGHVAMVGRIPGLWHIPKEKNRKYVSYGFSIIFFCNPALHHETLCIYQETPYIYGRLWLKYRVHTMLLPITSVLYFCINTGCST